MSRENAIRLHSILLLDLRNELSLKELQKVVCAATGWKLQFASGVLVGGLHRRQVSSTISVRDADYNQIRDTTVSGKEFNGTRGVAHVSVAVSHVEYRIAY